jgi:hypothetical protein
LFHLAAGQTEERFVQPQFDTPLHEAACHIKNTFLLNSE